ncbi:MAG: TonB-dependent receptor [Planctomycetota bacterium]|nr:MAG: TonB-dependent receptor [Planctomycetota bacterium]
MKILSFYLFFHSCQVFMQKRKDLFLMVLILPFFFSFPVLGAEKQRDSQQRKSNQEQEKKEKEQQQESLKMEDSNPTQNPNLQKKWAKEGERIVIIGSRTEEKIFESPRKIILVDKDEIREKNPRTAAEALRGKPGIWVQKTGHLGGAPIIRGFMGNRVIYLFDGIRRNTAGIFKGPNSFLQNIDALDIDRIEVIEGPGSVLYGSDAIGGVINVITNEKPRFSKSGYLWGGRLFSRYASVDREKSNRIEGFGATSNVYIFAGGTYRNIDDLQGGRGRGVQYPSSWRERDWDTQLDWKINKHHLLEVFYQDFFRPKGRRYDRINWKQANDRQLVGIQLKSKKVGIFERFKVLGYFHNQRDFIDEKFWDSRKHDKTWGTEVQGESRLLHNKLRLIYGAHFHWDHLTKSNPQKGTEDPEVDWYNPALFLLAVYEIGMNLRVDLGIRWDLFQLKSDAPAFNRLDSNIQNAINNGSFSLSDLELNETTNSVTGGFGLAYYLTDELNLFFHFGRALRAANKSDMLSFGQFTFGFNVPAGKLDPESAFTYEFGLKADSDNFGGSATFFYTELEDAIISRPGTFNGKDFVDVNGNNVKDNGENVYVNQNADKKIVAYGVELGGYYYLPPSWLAKLLGFGVWKIYGNFSWIYGKDHQFNEPLDRAYPANGTIGIRLENSRNPKEKKYWLAFEVQMVRHFSRFPSTRINSDPAVFADPQNKGSGFLRSDHSIPGYTIYSLFGGFRPHPRVNVSMGVTNLTDKLYRVKDSRIDAPGLSFVFSIEIQL